MEKTFYLNSNFESKKMPKASKGLKIAGYANTTDKDRVGDVVTAQAWAKGVDNYRKNPVLLYQHKHDHPIGKVDKVTVDKKGIFVEGIVSDAAEKLHGVQTLIKDGALKSFSVGFRVKDGKYDPHADSMTITDVELLEISVVSVPANQNSLFSIRKSFEADDEYNNFVKNFKESEEDMETEDTVLEEKSDEAISEAEVEIVEEKDTETTEVEEKATEESSEESVTEEKSAEPVLEMSQDEEEEQDFEEVDPMTPIPFVNLLSAETSSLDTKTFVKYEGKRFKITKIATAESPNFKFLEVDVNGKTVDNIVTVKAEEIAVVNTWDINTKYDIHVIKTALGVLTDSVRQTIKTTYNEVNTATEQSLFNLKSDERIEGSSDFQEKLNKLLNLKTNGDDWSDSDYVFANYLNVMVNELSQMKENDHRDLALKLHGHDINTVEKENNDMATQTAGDVLTIDTGATQKNQAEAKAAPVEVSEPRVAELIEKTGEAFLAEADAQDKQTIVHEKETAYTPKESEALAELKAQMDKYKEEIAALQNSKMVWQENQRSQTRWTPEDQTKAVLLAHALGKQNPLDTKFGSRMKADVTAVDQFLSNFSSNIYEQMQQQLVVAPMFERIAVDAKTFRVPVADEDTTDDVAQFASGTYASGIGDTTNVPTSGRSNAIKSVDFTPHKFMASTHIAKDEEEDTILPVIDFLRAGATRRLARAIDKSILRGTGALTGFTANSVASISGGAGFASVIKGVVELVNAVGSSALNVQTGGNSTKADAADIASARTLLGKYGLQLGDQLVYLTTVEGYNALVSSSDFQTVDKFGPNATYLTGSLGAIYGIPVVITEFLDNVGGADYDIGALVYKPGFMIAERRGMEIESEYEPRQQVTAMYMSTRIDFKALTTNSSAALDATKYPYAAVVRSGS